MAGQPQPHPVPPSNSVCSISLNRTDRLRLIEAPRKLIDGIRQAILQGWNQGIQNACDYYGSYEFKLRGNPWRGDGSEAVWSRSLITAVLTFMARSGWEMIQSTDISKKARDKSTIFFQQAQPDPEVQIFSMSFNMTDRIRVIGAAGVMPTVRRCVQSHWKYGIQNEREYSGSLELKLGSRPWYAEGQDTVLARVLLNHILTDIRGLGFKLYASLDLSVGTEDRGDDLDSWFFRRVGPIWS